MNVYLITRLSNKLRPPHLFPGLLSIEDRWKELALALGYTRREISTKFDPDYPIKEILTDFMGRGGDADEFIKAMYDVARRLKLIPYEQIMENRENKRMEIRHEGMLYNCIVSYCIVLYCIVLYCIELYFTFFTVIVLYCIVLYCFFVFYCVVKDYCMIDRLRQT